MLSTDMPAFWIDTWTKLCGILRPCPQTSLGLPIDLQRFCVSCGGLSHLGAMLTVVPCFAG